jgi:DNA-binding NtrC family response regulator
MGAPRILVVDDDPAMAQLLGEQLSAWGYEAALAHSVESALALLAATRFQLVLSDLHMPPRDGFQLLAAVRSRWPATAVALMSAFPAPDTEKQALEAGAFAFLSKPFSLDDLGKALERGLPRP